MRRISGVALALFAAALGSTAIADPWTDNTGGAHARIAPPPGQPHVTYDIVVDRFGNKARGSSGTSVSKQGTGIFIAEFPVDATLGRATTDGGVDEKAGFITVVRSSAFSDGVFVETFGMGNRSRSRPFHLLVAC
jgi:hypothetical protein